MKNNYREIFGERLKDLRLENELSIEALSKEVEIGIASLSRFENCKADVYAYQVIKLAEYFGVTTDYLLGLEN